MAVDTNRFPSADRDSLYRIMEQRRDVRCGFLPVPLPEDVLTRLLHAAHCAPSVGLMQPARFIVIRDPGRRERVHQAFQRANQAAAEKYEGDQRQLYDGLKLQGLLEAPLHLCVVCDHRSEQGHGLGRQTMPQMSAYSTVCAVQNLWLAARAEGIGVGWVSIFNPEDLRSLLEIPEGVEVVAYLCAGYVSEFAERPDLERFGWESRRELEEVLFSEHFGEPYRPGARTDE